MLVEGSDLARADRYLPQAAAGRAPGDAPAGGAARAPTRLVADLLASVDLERDAVLVVGAVPPPPASPPHGGGPARPRRRAGAAALGEHPARRLRDAGRHRPDDPRPRRGRAPGVDGGPPLRADRRRRRRRGRGARRPPGRHRPGRPLPRPRWSRRSRSPSSSCRRCSGSAPSSPSGASTARSRAVVGGRRRWRCSLYLPATYLAGTHRLPRRAARSRTGGSSSGLAVGAGAGSRPRSAAGATLDPLLLVPRRSCSASSWSTCCSGRRCS